MWERYQQIADLEAEIAALREGQAVEILRVRAEGYETGLAQARAERDTALWPRPTRYTPRWTMWTRGWRRRPRR